MLILAIHYNVKFEHSKNDQRNGLGECLDGFSMRDDSGAIRKYRVRWISKPFAITGDLNVKASFLVADDSASIL